VPPTLKAEGEWIRNILIENIGEPESIGGYDHNFDCPLCHSSHLHVNFVKGVAICHGCNAKYRNLKNLLRDLGLSFKFAGPKGSKAIQAVFDMFKKQRSVADDGPLELELPKEFRRLFAGARDAVARSMFRYLKSRGVTESQIEEYAIGYCSSGRYDGCILFPVYVNGLRLFFTTRRVFGPGPKTFNPDVGESKRYVLMGYDRCVERESRRVYIVEGPFDLLALELAGLDGVAVMGSTITKEQSALLSKLDAELVVCFDPDAWDKTKRYATFLSDNTANPVFTCRTKGDNDLSDLAELGARGVARIQKILSKVREVGMEHRINEIFNEVKWERPQRREKRNLLTLL
jgi:hypothetical protein